MRYFYLFLNALTRLILKIRFIRPTKDKVILLHGLIRHSSMSNFSRHLLRDGWDVEIFYYPSRNGSIEDHAKRLVDRLKEIDTNKPIHFVGYSLGGIILKAALNHLECPQCAFSGKISLIAVPNNGSEFVRNVGKSRFGRLFLGKHSGKQLYQTTSEGFDYLGDFPTQTPILVLSGTKGSTENIEESTDGKVSVIESCIPTAHEHKFINTRHKKICDNINTIKETIHFFEKSERTDHCPLSHS